LSELLRLRNLRGFTQADLAVLAERSEAAISRFERGELRPAPETIVKLAQALRVSSTRLNALLPDAPLDEAPVEAGHVEEAPVETEPFDHAAS
jgi:transcriptional regulator with XRE-family HTH domain